MSKKINDTIVEKVNAAVKKEHMKKMDELQKYEK